MSRYSRHRSLLPAYGLVFLLVVAISASPIARLFVRLIDKSEFLPLLWEPANLKALWATLRVSLLALFGGVSLALPVSWLLVRSNLPGRNAFRKIFLFPYMLPPYLFAIAWMTLAVPQIGFLNRIFGNAFNIYSTAGLVWVFVNAFLPILISSICTAMESMDPSLEEAARVMGASPAKTVWAITFPCILPSIFSSSLLFLLAVMAAFGIPALVGDPARIYVLTTKIYNAIKLGGLTGVDQAVVVALWLFLFAGLFIALNEYLRRRFASRLVGGKASRHSRITLGRFQWPVFLLTVFVSVCLIFLPLGAVFLNSFLRVGGELSFKNLTLANYEYLWAMPEFATAVTNSLVFSVVAGLTCGVIAFFIAYFKDRTSFPGRRLLENLATFPFAVPGAVVALALIVSFGMGWGNPNWMLLGSPLLLVMAYVMKYLALSVQNLSPAVSQIHPSLDEAARVFGAGPWRVLRSILLPLVSPVMMTVFILTALPVFSELTMSVLLMGPGLETVGTLVFQLQEYANPLAACSLATLLVLFLVSVLGLVRLLGGRI